MGDMEKTGDDQKNIGEDKIHDEIIISNPENPSGAEGIKFVSFSHKGIFGRDGFLAALDLESSELLGSSSSTLGIIKEPLLANADDDDDAKNYQGSSGTAKKIKLSTGSEVLKNCYQKDKTITSNNGIENSSCSLEERVFSIDHILESIFSELDRETLLACRLVSRRWSYFTSKALQKIVNILMVHKEQRYPNNEERPYYYFYAKKRLCLEDLIALVESSSEFPSTSFYFRNKNKDELDPSAESFFKAHGPMIKKLTFDGWVSLSDVKQLLFTQAPNLQQLFLTHLCGVLDPIDPSSLEENAQTNGSLSDGSTITPRPTLANLKLFKCGAHIPRIFAQHILEWSPNLVEVELPVEYFHLLIKPKNRLHLLKKVNTDIVEDKILKELEGVAKHHENNLVLEEIYFCMLPTSNRGDRYSRAVIAISKIWEASSATCHKVSLDYCFDLNLVCRMPQLKSLSFYGYYSESARSPFNLLGRLSSMGDKYPKLTTLNIRILARTTMNTFFRGPVSARVLSVKDIYFSLSPHELVLQRFKEMFPNATLHPFTLKFEDDTETFDDFDMMFA